ncbi:MAG: S46 family peptidase, partial [FCB group bacterium]|nr:S46 family peptidase [FCB group bacterium]
MNRYFSILTIISLITTLFTAMVLADEGMWPLYSLDKLSNERYIEAGLELKPEDIYNPEGGGLCEAIVRVGASGSFVSKDGLIITNHHVAYGAVQKQSTVEVNLVRDGFYAATRGEELPALGYNTWVTLSIEDVTERVLAEITDDMDDLARYKAIDKVTKAIIAETEEGQDIKARVAKMFAGKQYVLYRQFKIRDVRIVYVPPEMIGVYGGDIDNWMWPRHTGDFSFLRAYVAPDGSSAEYAEDNVPFQPSRFLPIAKNGVNDGDFAMIIGFPGRTNRYASSYQMDDLINHSYPRRIALYKDILRIIDDVSKDDPETAIRLKRRVQGYNNGLKNRIGMLEGFERGNLLTKKLTAEIELTKFIKANPEFDKKYNGVLAGLDSLYGAIRLTRDRDYILSLLAWADHPEMACEIYRWAMEQQKPDPERDRGYQNRDSVDTREWLEDAQINLVPAYDRALHRYALLSALNLPEGSRIRAIDNMIDAVEGDSRAAKIENWLDYAFENTNVGDLKRRMEMFGMSVAELEALDDPFIAYAKALYPDREARRERKKEQAGTSNRLEPKLITAYADWRQNDLYPDANSTMRVNFGIVNGYRVGDTTEFGCFTTVAGVIAKETGEDPF